MPLKVDSSNHKMLWWVLSRIIVPPTGLQSNCRRGIFTTHHSKRAVPHLCNNN